MFKYGSEYKISFRTISESDKTFLSKFNCEYTEIRNFIRNKSLTSKNNVTKSRRNAPCFSYGDVRRFFVNLTYIRFIHIL